MVCNWTAPYSCQSTDNDDPCDRCKYYIDGNDRIVKVWFCYKWGMILVNFVFIYVTIGVFFKRFIWGLNKYGVAFELISRDEWKRCIKHGKRVINNRILRVDMTKRLNNTRQ